MIKISCLNEKARKFVIRHCHDEMEINVFLSGQGTYLVNGVEYPVRAGDVFLFHPCMFHCLYNDSGNYYARCERKFKKFQRIYLSIKSPQDKTCGFVISLFTVCLPTH